jgi:hypothetical protein
MNTYFSIFNIFCNFPASARLFILRMQREHFEILKLPFNRMIR